MTPIVVVAYNRANSLKRILKFISQGFYPDGNIPLIISIDKGDNDDVIKILYCSGPDLKFSDKWIRIGIVCNRHLRHP